MSPTFQQIPVDQLEFDEQNPRFPRSLTNTGNESILGFMLSDAGLLDLMRSIAAQGFFPGEPLLVCPTEGGHTWIVVEGNRRLAACTLLHKPGLAPKSKVAVQKVALGVDPSTFTPVPCLVFKSRNEIMKHLGYRHVTGIKEWEPVAKARFLQQQFDDLNEPFDERFKLIARTIGSRADYVGRLLTAHQLFEQIEDHNFFGITDLGESTINFSLITSALSYQEVVSYLGLKSSSDIEMQSLNRNRIEFLTKFIFERKHGQRTLLGESRNFRILAEVLGNASATAALESGVSLSQAAKISGFGAEAFRGLLIGAFENLQLAGDQLGEARPDEHDLETLEQVRRAAKSIRDDVRKILNGDSE
jgi:hypothetical protein